MRSLPKQTQRRGVSPGGHDRNRNTWHTARASQGGHWPCSVHLQPERAWDQTAALWYPLPKEGEARQSSLLMKLGSWGSWGVSHGLWGFYFKRWTRSQIPLKLRSISFQNQKRRLRCQAALKHARQLAQPFWSQCGFGNVKGLKVSSMCQFSYARVPSSTTKH